MTEFSSIISNPDLENIIARFVVDGKDHLHVIADFDRTLTTAFVDGQGKTSLIARLRDGYLPQEYTDQSQAIFEKYHPIEIDPDLPLDKKRAYMLEWRTLQSDLMVKYGLSKTIIQKAMENERTNFRVGCQTFFELLHKHNIPLLIFSASVLGYEGIYHCMLSEGLLSPNVAIISNTFIRDDQGKALRIKEPIIHSFNKGETVVHTMPIYQEIRKRKNLLLLGDSTGDVHMADGFDYENIIKIGFLNHDTPQNRQHFSQKYDLIILDDGPMDVVNNLLKDILA